MLPHRLVFLLLFWHINSVSAADRIVLFQNLSPISGPTIVASAKRIFQDQGLEVEVRNVTSGKLALDAVLGGSAQFATTSEVPVMRAALANQTIAVVATMEASDNDAQILVRNDRKINTLQDLKGKRIGTAIGTSAEYLVVAALEKASLKPKDITLINLRPQDMATALYRGDIDGYAIWEPHVYNGLKLMAGDAKRLDTRGLYLETFNIIGMRDFVSKSSNVVERFLRALIEAEDFIKKNPIDANKIIADAIQMDSATFVGIRPNFNFHIGLDHTLVDLMKKQAAWDATGGKPALVPDPDKTLLDTIVTAPLASVAQGRVTGFR